MTNKQYQKYARMNINDFTFSGYATTLNGNYPVFSRTILENEDICLQLEVHCYKGYKNKTYTLKAIKYDKQKKSNWMLSTGFNNIYIENETTNRFSFENLKEMMNKIDKSFIEKVMSDYNNNI